MTKRYWEDFEVGEVREYGSKTVTKEEVIAFGRQFDPQPFHVDEDAANAMPFGGLLASGWHTGSMFMRMFADNLLADSASLGAPSIDRLRWTQPVRPGDVLSVRTTVLSKSASKSRPEIGFVQNRHEVLNQDGTVVMWCEGPGMIQRRNPDATV